MHCGHAAGFWTTSEQDLDCAVDLHLAYFRLSIRCTCRLRSPPERDGLTSAMLCAEQCALRARRRLLEPL